MTDNIVIERIGKHNYDDFCRMIVCRMTGEDSGDICRFKQPETLEFFKKYNILDSNMFFIFSARRENRFVGWITASMIPKPDPRLGTLYIDELWVSDIHRNKGVATKLIENVLEVAKDMGLWRVRLYVNTENNAARALYKKAGFEEKDSCLFCEFHLNN